MDKLSCGGIFWRKLLLSSRLRTRLRNCGIILVLLKRCLLKIRCFCPNSKNAKAIGMRCWNLASGM